MKANINQAHALVLILFVIFSLLFAKPAFAGGDGSRVGNGGGLSEQALLFSSLKLRSFLTGCLKYDDCGQRNPQNEFFRKLLTCSLPSTDQISFSVPSEDPALENVSYIRKNSERIIINREQLYDANGLAMRLPAAAVFLASVFADDCRLSPFASNLTLAAPLAVFVSKVGEQVTIGKDSIQLPSSQWIRVRSLDTDLLLESATELIRLTCADGTLETCSPENVPENLPVSAPAVSQFKNLSLTSESYLAGLVHFEIEANFYSSDGTVQLARLAGTTRDGIFIELKLNDRILK